MASKVRPRMRYLPRAVLAGGLGFATSLIIAACGGGAGLLSGGQAGTLSNQLNQISNAVAAGNCGQAGSASRALVNAVSNLPSTISSNLRQDLSQGAATVSELATTDCRSTSTATTPTTPTTATVTTPTTATTTTRTTPTTPTTATTTTPATTTTTPGTTTGPASGGGGLSGGSGGGGGLPGADNGNGNGNGNG
jgi:hypothetical protein